MTMRLISTPNAPKPVAAYSQAVVSNGVIYCAGSVGVDPQTGKLVDGLPAQAEQIFKNVAAILHAAGSHPGRVLRVTIFLSDMSQFATVNGIYERFVGDHRPARTTVGVATLPLGALIEVDVTAEADDLTL